jgi:SagB-type dehydrogenase family enzyme
MSLTEALAKRRSARAYTAEPLTQQQIAQLLWAAQGVTDDKGHRTAPSAHAEYYLHVYVATADGFFRYDPPTHTMTRLVKTDVRAALSEATGGQASVAKAPAVFVITVDHERGLAKAGPERVGRLVYVEAGHACQNILLQATALGLAGVPVGGFDDAKLAKTISAGSGEKPAYLVPIGHPQK